MKIGVSGDAGSFSEAAGLQYAAQHPEQPYTLAYLIDMEGVLSALSRNEIDVGVFPFFNHQSGMVWPAFTAMGKHRFVPIADIALNIEQCLLTTQPRALADIETLYSYPPAFQQCTSFIRRQGFRLIDWGDTAKAARDLAAGIIPNTAGVVASQRAAEHYGLHVLQAGIQDLASNITQFVVVKKGDCDGNH